MKASRLLMALSLVMGWMLVSSCNEREAAKSVSGPVISPTLLDGDAAFARVKAFVDLGPKPAGTPEGEKAAQWIHDELAAAGLEPEITVFEDKVPSGTNTFRNVRAVLPGDPEKLIILGCHFDTKVNVAEGFVGANDSGSGVGLMLELAAVLNTHLKGKKGPEIHFAFFDGEECVVHYGVHDGFHGSRHMAQQYVDDDRAKDVIAVIVLDMVGHDDLSITIPQNCSRHLVAKVFEASHTLGCREKFRLFGKQISDDHTPFFVRGMPAIDLIDFAYGSAPSLNDYWHTDQDTMDKLSPKSLELVGQVTLEMINLLNIEPRPAE